MIFAVATLLYGTLVFLSVISLKAERSMKKTLAFAIIHMASLFLLVLLFQDLPAYLREEHIEGETATIVENYRIAKLRYPKAFQVFLEDGRQYIGLGNLRFSKQRYEGKALRIYVLPRTKLITKLEFEKIPDSYWPLYNLDDLLWKWLALTFFVLVFIGLWKMIRKKDKEVVRQNKKKRTGKQKRKKRQPQQRA